MIWVVIMGCVRKDIYEDTIEDVVRLGGLDIFVRRLKL